MRLEHGKGLVDSTGPLCVHPSDRGPRGSIKFWSPKVEDLQPPE